MSAASAETPGRAGPVLAGLPGGDGMPDMAREPGAMIGVRLEVMPLLASLFSPGETGHLILHRTVRDGETIRALLDQLARDYEGCDGVVFNTRSQQLTDHVNLVLNGGLIELGDWLDTRLKSGDNILILPAFAGGS